jgi:hypothetical protein
VSRDPLAPDLAGACRRHPRWVFGRDGDDWTAQERGGLAELRGRSLESLEGKVTRAETAWSAVGDAARHMAS